MSIVILNHEANHVRLKHHDQISRYVGANPYLIKTDSQYNAVVMDGDIVGDDDYYAFLRNIEVEADEAVRNDCGILQGAIDWISRFMWSLCDDGGLEPKKNDTHPRNAQRLKRFAERKIAFNCTSDYRDMDVLNPIVECLPHGCFMSELYTTHPQYGSAFEHLKQCLESCKGEHRQLCMQDFYTAIAQESNEMSNGELTVLQNKTALIYAVAGAVVGCSVYKYRDTIIGFLRRAKERIVG